MKSAIRYMSRERIKASLDKRRCELSDTILLMYFKGIRYQCKWMGRDVGTLLEYINELEFRCIKYRL